MAQYILTRDGILDAAKMHNALFIQKLEKLVPQPIEKMAAEFKVLETGKYNFLMGTPPMQKKSATGTVPTQPLSANYFSLTNESWWTSVTIDADDFKTDKLGMITPRVEAMPGTAYQARATALISLITNGFATAGWDSTGYFFGTHTTGDTTFVNAVSANPVFATSWYSALATMWAAMTNQVNDQGQLLNIVPDTLWCSPTQWPLANQIYTSDWVYASGETYTKGTPNPYKGMFKPLMIPGLSSLYWGLADMSKDLKPFILQTQSPETTVQDEMGAIIYRSITNGVEFMVDISDLKNDNVLYRIKHRFQVGYGMHQLIIGSTGAGS